jgi:hypothetical protein
MIVGNFAGDVPAAIASSWTVEAGDVRPSGTPRKRRPGEHARTADQEAKRRARARGEAARRRSQR